MQKIIIILDGGLVQEVLADTDIEAYVLDRDICFFPEETHPIVDGRKSYIHEPFISNNPDRINNILKEIKELGGIPGCKCGNDWKESCAAKYIRLRSQRLIRRGKYLGIEPCRDCGVLPGGIHHMDCDQEICPLCGDQLLSCDCWVHYEE